MGKSLKSELVTPSSKEMVDQYLITVADYLNEGYEQKVKSGELEVFSVIQPPAPTASDAEKQAYQHILETYGNGEMVTSVRKEGDSYFAQVNGQKGEYRMRADRQLVVLPKVK